MGRLVFLGGKRGEQGRRSSTNYEGIVLYKACTGVYHLTTYHSPKSYQQLLSVQVPPEYLSASTGEFKISFSSLVGGSATSLTINSIGMVFPPVGVQNNTVVNQMNRTWLILARTFFVHRFHPPKRYNTARSDLFQPFIGIMSCVRRQEQQTSPTPAKHKTTTMKNKTSICSNLFRNHIYKFKKTYTYMYMRYIVYIYIHIHIYIIPPVKTHPPQLPITITWKTKERCQLQRKTSCLRASGRICTGFQ